MSHKIELNNGRIAYCETINPKKLNEIEARFGSKIKSVAGYDTTTKAENGTKAGGYVRDMSNLDIPMYIFNVFIRWDGMVKTSLPSYPSGKKYKNLRKKIELLEYTKPNEYTANFAPLNWVDNKGRRYFETYADGSNDDYFDDMTKSGYAAYYYFFPKDKFSVTEAQKLINAEHPRNFGFTLDKHPDLYAYGNKIPNHYNGMEGEEVWNNWNKTQRTHFLHDHFSGWTEHYEYIPFEYNKLPKKIQEEVDYHVSMGQYKKGGRMFKKGGSTEKPNFKKLAETNHYGLDEKDLETLWDEGNVEINHWTFFHVGNEWETIYDGLYMEVFSSFEDMLNRENQKAYYEYSEELSDKLGEETFADENGNIREYGDGGSIGDFFAQELGAIGTTIDKAEKGKKLGFAFQVGDKVMVNDDKGYAKFFYKGYNLDQPATITERHKIGGENGRMLYYYNIQFADGRKPFDRVPQGLLEPYTEKFALGGDIKKALEIADGSIFSKDFLDKYEIVKETYSTSKNADAEAQAKKRKKELTSQGYFVKLRKRDFSDLARATGYFITAIKEKTEKFGLGGGVRDNRMNERTRAVILKIQKTGIHPDDVSPNFVNEIANEYNIKLTSEEVVFISDNYGNKMAKGGGVRDEMFSNELYDQYEESYVPIDLEKEIILPNGVTALWIEDNNGKVNIWKKGFGDLAFAESWRKITKEKLLDEAVKEYDVKNERLRTTGKTYKTSRSTYAKGGGVGDTIADRYARLTEKEAKRLDELSKKVRINEQTDAEDIEWDKLVHKYRGWDYKGYGKYAKGGQTDLFDEEIAEMVDETPDMTETKTKYRAEVGATGENTWSTNSMEYDTEDEAKNWLKGLASRWFGYNISRVVPVSTPRGETIDVSTQNVFQNYRKHGGTTFPIWRKQKYEGGGSTEQAKKGKKIDDARYPRRADDTGKGIMQGWVVGDAYYETEQGALQSVKDLGYDTIEDAYENDEIYFTDWHDENLEEQGYYYTADGKEIELSAKGSVVKISKSEMDEMANRGMNKLTKKTWKVVYITMQGKEGSKIIELGRLSDREDVKNALKRMPDLNIREIVKIQEIAKKGTKIKSGYVINLIHPNGKKDTIFNAYGELKIFKTKELAEKQINATLKDYNPTIVPVSEAYRQSNFDDKVKAEKGTKINISKSDADERQIKTLEQYGGDIFMLKTPKGVYYDIVSRGQDMNGAFRQLKTDANGRKFRPHERLKDKETYKNLYVSWNKITFSNLPVLLQKDYLENWNHFIYKNGGNVKAEKGTKTGKGFMVFNYTDNIYASPDIFKTRKEANEFIAKFRARFEKQGYYRDNRMRQIAIKDIDLLAIPEDFNPFRKN